MKESNGKTVAIAWGESGLDDQLLEKGAAFTALELKLPEDLPLEDWAAIGRRLCRADQVAKWWLGDWAAFGAGDKKAKGWRKHGQLKQFADANGVNYQTLRDLAWVSGKVDLSRRRDKLEWSKHKEVAALPAQEQKEWLEAAEAKALPVAEMRRQIRQSKGENNALASDGPIIKFASKSCDDLVNWLKGRPEEFWDEDRRAAWRKRLQPIVTFWEGL